MQHTYKNHLNNIFLTLEYDPINDWYFANWKGFASAENIKIGALAYLELLKENPNPYLLNSNQELKGPWDKSNDWLQTIWVPMARDMGLQYMAHVLAPNISAALSAQELHQRIDGNFEMRIFGEMDKAKAWLSHLQTGEKPCPEPGI